MEENTTPKRTYQKHKIIGKITIKHFTKVAKSDDGDMYELYIEIIAKKQNTRFHSHINFRESSIEELMEKTKHERDEEIKILEFITDGLNIFHREDFKISEIYDVFKWLNNSVSTLTEHLLKSEIKKELIAKNEYDETSAIMLLPQALPLDSSFVLLRKYLDDGFKSSILDKYKSNIWIIKSFEEILNFKITKKIIEKDIEIESFEERLNLLKITSLHSFLRGIYQKLMLDFNVHPEMKDTFSEIYTLIEESNPEIFRLFDFFKIIRRKHLLIQLFCFIFVYQ